MALGRSADHSLKLIPLGMVGGFCSPAVPRISQLRGWNLMVGTQILQSPKGNTKVSKCDTNVCLAVGKDVN
jgi:hypothetical protein